jgi:hypothetical protein
MAIKIVDGLDAALLDDAWHLYRDTFQHLDAAAVQRHLMYRAEFDHVMADRRVDKYLALDSGGAMCGLATYTNDLDAVPLIAPAYFARRWPAHFAERRIWYIGFVAVHPDHQGSSTFAELVEAFRTVAAPAGGLVGWDVCAANLARRLPQVVLRMVSGPSPGVVLDTADAQTYVVYEFPTPTAEAAQ